MKFKLGDMVKISGNNNLFGVIIKINLEDIFSNQVLFNNINIAPVSYMKNGEYFDDGDTSTLDIKKYDF